LPFLSRIFQPILVYRAAAKLAKEVAAEGGALTLGGVSQCPSYLTGKTKEEVQAEFRKQVKVFVEEDLDFLLCEVSVRRRRTWRTKQCRLCINNNGTG
jgi:betaine-homocysteine S-methyltransferase